MKSKWIYYFSLLAEKQNIEITASSLNIKISTLKQNIKLLENHLNKALFNASYTKLTPAGEIFKTQSLSLLVSLERICQIGTPKTSITIGWSDFWGYALLPKILDQIGADHKVEAESYHRNWPLLIQAFKSGVIDVALTTYSVNGHLVLPEMEDFAYSISTAEETTYEILGAPALKETSWQDLKYIHVNGSLNNQSPIPIWNDALYKRQIFLKLPHWHLARSLCEQTSFAIYIPLLLATSAINNGSLKIITPSPQKTTAIPCLLISPGVDKKVKENLISIFTGDKLC